jgi:hypothetical protein
MSSRNSSAASPSNNGHDNRGRFSRGNPGGPGNPFAGSVAKLRKAALEVVTPEEIQGVFRVLLLKAQTGHLPSVKLLLAYTIGQPAATVDPDEVEEQRIEAEARAHEPVETAPVLPDLPHRAGAAAGESTTESANPARPATDEATVRAAEQDQDNKGSTRAEQSKPAPARKPKRARQRGQAARGDVGGVAPPRSQTTTEQGGETSEAREEAPGAIPDPDAVFKRFIERVREAMRRAGCQWTVEPG